jgi:hypothetical protein
VGTLPVDGSPKPFSGSEIVKPRVVQPSSDDEPAPKVRLPREQGPDRPGESEPEVSMGDRFSKAARYHSILVGRGAHHVRHGIRRIGKHRAVQGVKRAIGNRWWPNAGSAQDGAPTERRWKLPMAFPRRAQTASAEGAAIAAAHPHHLQRLAWDFAVVTVAVAILVILHHQFKRPHRSLAHRSMLAAAVEPAADGQSLKVFKRHNDERHDGAATAIVAAANHPVDDFSGTSRDLAPADATKSPPTQSEPPANSGDLGHLDANQTVAKHDDLPTPTATTPAEPVHTDLTPLPGPDNSQPQTHEASKPPATADAGAPSLLDPPQNADPPTAPPKRRHRHKPSDATPVASGDAAFPNLDPPAQGPGDSTAKPATAAPDLSAGTKATLDPPKTSGPGPSLADDHPTPQAAPLAPAPAPALPVVAKDGPPPASGSQAKKGDVDIFGSLQDPPAEKHDAKGPDLGAAPPADKPVDGAPHRRHRKKPLGSEGPAPEPVRTADQSPPSDAIVDSKPKVPDLAAPTEPKPADKVDPPVPSHDHDLKGPDAGFTPPADQPPADPPKHRRRRKPPGTESTTPDPLHVGDLNPSNGPPAETKPPEPDKAPPTLAPAPEPKKTDEWNVPSGAPAPKPAPEELKPDHAPDKPTPAADHDLLGTLKDEHVDKHEAGDKGPEPAVSPPPTDSAPPGGDAPKHRRRKKPPESAPTIPAPTPAAEPGPTLAPAPTPKAADSPAPTLSDAPKSDVKPSESPVKEPKPTEAPALGAPPIADAPAAKPEPKPEPLPVPSAPPVSVPEVSPPARPVVDESQANVSFTRSLPEKADSGNLFSYKIVVRNNGTKLLKVVEIDEAVPADHTVHSTEPAAEVHDQTLHWNVRDLAPHEATTIAITLAAPPAPQPVMPAISHPKPERPEEDQFKTTKADESASLPHVELELIAPAVLRTGETCRVGFKATNLGSKTSGLKLNLDLPTQIHFVRGQKLQYKVGDLDGHESREDYLTAVATAPGVVEIHGSILLDGRTLASAKATCRIDGAPAIKQAARTRRDPFVVPASASQVAPPSPQPCNCGP